MLVLPCKGHRDARHFPSVLDGLAGLRSPGLSVPGMRWLNQRGVHSRATDEFSPGEGSLSLTRPQFTLAIVAHSGQVFGVARRVVSL